MFYFTVFSANNNREVEDFFEIVQIFNKEIVLISFDIVNNLYEITLDVKSFGYEKYIPKSVKDSYENYYALKKYFERSSIEEYIEDYKNIYISDDYEFTKIYIYARNLKNNELFNMDGTKKNILKIAPTIKEKSEIRIWNQQFKQYLKTDYPRFLKYCLSRGNWEVSFNPNVFEKENKLEILQNYYFNNNESNEENYIDSDDEIIEENEDRDECIDRDEYYDELEEMEIELF